MFHRIILLWVCLVQIFALSVFASSESCTWNGDFFADCKPEYVIDDTTTVGIQWIKEKTINIANRLIVVGSVFSIGAIVLGGFFYASSMGSDEKVKKGKDAIKWGIVGLIVMIVSFAAVNSIVDFIYTLQP